MLRLILNATVFTDSNLVTIKSDKLLSLLATRRAQATMTAVRFIFYVRIELDGA